MAGVMFKCSTAEVATTTNLRTIIQVQAGSNHRVLVHEWSISFDGTSNSAEPILVELVRQTSDGTMGSSLTPFKYNTGDDETVQASIRDTATVEPNGDDVLDIQEVHPQTGYTWQAPYGRSIPIVGGGRLGIRVTAGASINCVATMTCEE